MNPKNQEGGSKVSAATISGIVDAVWEELGDLPQAELDRLEGFARSVIRGENFDRVFCDARS